MPVETLIPVQEPPATAPTFTVYKYVQVYEQVWPFNPLLLVLLVLLLMLLILRLTRKKKTDR
jgi:hypothetical protein